MPRQFPIDVPQYVQLRTMLDSVMAGALRFYLDPLEFDKQKENYQFLETHLMAISNRVWHREEKAKVKMGKRKADPNDPCPDGYYNCGGCCVPYECVFGADIPDHK